MNLETVNYTYGSGMEYPSTGGGTARPIQKFWVSGFYMKICKDRGTYSMIRLLRKGASVVPGQSYAQHFLCTKIYNFLWCNNKPTLGFSCFCCLLSLYQFLSYLRQSYNGTSGKTLQMKVGRDAAV